MNSSEHISPFGRKLLDRRGFMNNSALALGGLGLSSLLAEEDTTNFTGKSPIRPVIDPDKPYTPRAPHHDTPAKRVLIIFCPGAVSHVDTFDYKPRPHQIPRPEASRHSRRYLRGPHRKHRQTFLGFQTARPVGKNDL